MLYPGWLLLEKEKTSKTCGAIAAPGGGAFCHQLEEHVLHAGPPTCGTLTEAQLSDFKELNLLLVSRSEKPTNLPMRI